MFGIVIAELIMAVRIWALWGNSGIIGVFLGVCTVALTAIGAIFYGRFSEGLAFIDTTSIAPNLPGCLRGPGSRVLYVGYLGLAAYEAVLMGLSLTKGIRDLRHISTSFLHTFYQDGIVYYVVSIDFNRKRCHSAGRAARGGNSLHLATINPAFCPFHTHAPPPPQKCYETAPTAPMLLFPSTLSALSTSTRMRTPCPPRSVPVPPLAGGKVTRWRHGFKMVDWDAKLGSGSQHISPTLEFTETVHRAPDISSASRGTPIHSYSSLLSQLSITTRRLCIVSDRTISNYQLLLSQRLSTLD